MVKKRGAVSKRVYYCNVCGKRYKTEASIRKHAWTHRIKDLSIEDEPIEFFFSDFINPEKFSSHREGWIRSIEDSGFKYESGFIGKNPFFNEDEIIR